MQTGRTLASVLTLVLALTSLAQAGTDSDRYVASGGVITDTTSGLTLIACPDRHDHCDLLGDGGRDIPFGVGAVRLRNPDGPVQNVVVSANDDLFGSGAAIMICVYNPNGDPTICGPDEDHVSSVGCGTAILTAFPWSSDSVLVIVWSLYVSDDLDVCGATSGTATADFF